MNVSDLLLETLSRHGVRRMYGIPGDAINDLIDAIRRQDEIRYIQVRHEEAGAFAASAEAKLTGELACCFGTSGPGAIHLLNGLYDAKMDHAPVIAITGQVATGYIGSEYHQEIGMERLFADVACFTETLTDIAQLPGLFQNACRAALAHRGVAHIAIPTNLSGQKVKVDVDRLRTFARPGRIMPAPDDCRAAIDLIEASDRIAILAGIGCAEAKEELVALAEHLKAPIVRTLRAKDFIDESHPQCVGGLGLLGDPPGIAAVEGCDLLLMVGTDFPYTDFYPDGAKFVQIDRAGTHIGRRHPVDAGMVGDAGLTLDYLRSQLSEKEGDTFFKLVDKAKAGWRSLKDRMEGADDDPIKPPRLMREIASAAPDKSIFLADTGTSTAWTARHLPIGEAQRYTLSGGLASMAFAMPGAIGAQLAFPEHRAVAICGDGAFGMLMTDFITAVRYELPIVVIVLRNGKLAFITLEMESKGLQDFGTDIANPDYAAVAQASGGIGIAVDRPAAIAPALEQAFASKQPVLIDVAVDPDALIIPPRIDLGQVTGFTMAKLKEAWASLTD